MASSSSQPEQKPVRLGGLASFFNNVFASPDLVGIPRNDSMSQKTLYLTYCVAEWFNISEFCATIIQHITQYAILCNEVAMSLCYLDLTLWPLSCT